MHIAIASSKNELPPSDRALLNALIAEQVQVTPVLWSSHAVDWDQFDCTLVRSCWDYHLRLPEFLDWLKEIEDSGMVVLNPPDLIRWNSDKRYLCELAAAGIGIPETLWLEQSEIADVGEVCRERGWQSAVVKPLVSASAYQTELRSSGAARGPVMVQEYVSAIENGEWSLMYCGGEFSHAVRKRPKAGEFRVQAEFGGVVERAYPEEHLPRFAQTVLDKMPLAAATARVDVVETDRGYLLMELEVIEPELFLEGNADAAARAARAVLNSLAEVAGR